jgi:chromate transport protein ChrA
MSEIDLETRKRRRKATNDSQSVEESEVSVESAQSDCNDNETDVEVGSGGRVEQMSASTQPRKSTFVRFFLGPNENDETAHAADDEERATVPTKNILQIFWLFTLFGLRAFGGPVAQIAMMKQELVIEQRWISVAQFNRVNSVYQALPGPEATELAVYFGVKTCGRIGGVAGGIGFIWPGFCLVLLISYLYQQYGVTAGVLASLTAMRPAVSAMFLRAIYKMSQHAFLDHGA